MFLSSDYYNGSSRPTCTQILVASSIGLIIAAAMHYRLKKIRDQKIIPRIKVSDTGQVEKLERFSHYVGIKSMWSSIFPNTLLDFGSSILSLYTWWAYYFRSLFHQWMQLGKWDLQIDENVHICASWLLIILGNLKGVKRIYMHSLLKNQMPIRCI